MRLGSSKARRRWAVRGGFALLAVALAVTFGVPAQRGCGASADSACEPLVETPTRPLVNQPPSAPPTVIYLNRDGATLRGDYDDAARNASSVVAGCGLPSVTLPPAPLDDATWTEVVLCLRQEFARFNVRIVDERPTEPGYVMAVFGGTGAELGLGADVRGRAPLDSSGCQTVDGAVVLVFSGKLGALSQPHCEVAAQEIAHVFSVDHELLAADAASYLPFDGLKTFQDLDAPCGELEERACICGRASQNSVQVLLQHLGQSAQADAVPPVLTAAAERQRPGFVSVTVQATDPSGIATVALTYRDEGMFVSSTCGDGLLPCIATGSTYTFTVAGASGTASYTATAVDTVGNLARTSEAQMTVDQSAPLPSPVTLRADAASSGGTVTIRAIASSSAGAIASAVVYWTDARGITERRALCDLGDGTWSLPVTLAADPQPRSYVVVATDASDRSAYTPPARVTIQ